MSLSREHGISSKRPALREQLQLQQMFCFCPALLPELIENLTTSNYSLTANRDQNYRSWRSCFSFNKAACGIRWWLSLKVIKWSFDNDRVIWWNSINSFKQHKWRTAHYHQISAHSMHFEGLQKQKGLPFPLKFTSPHLMPQALLFTKIVMHVKHRTTWNKAQQLRTWLQFWQSGIDAQLSPKARGTQVPCACFHCPL